jgi:hypothetical protein
MQTDCGKHSSNDTDPGAKASLIHGAQKDPDQQTNGTCSQKLSGLLIVCGRHQGHLCF